MQRPSQNNLSVVSLSIPCFHIAYHCGYHTPSSACVFDIYIYIYIVQLPMFTADSGGKGEG